MNARPHPAIYPSDWWNGDLGKDGKVVSSPSGLARKSTITAADIIVDNADIVGISMALSEKYSALISVDSGLPSSIQSPFGMYAVFAPGQKASMQFEGNGRFLNVGLSASNICKSLFDDFEIYGDGLDFITSLGQVDFAMARAMLRVATVDAENAYQAVVSCVALLVQNHSSSATGVQKTRSRSLTPMRLRRVLSKIEDDLATPLTLRELAQTAGITCFYFSREFHLMTGYSPHQYVVRRRIQRAIRNLLETSSSVEVIAREVGFYRGSHMSRHMQRILGLTPNELRRLVDNKRSECG